MSPRAKHILADCIRLGGSFVIFGILATTTCWWYCLGWTIGWAATLAWFRYYARGRVDPVDAFVIYGGIWWALLPSMAMLVIRDARNRRLERRRKSDVPDNVVHLSDRRPPQPRKQA